MKISKTDYLTREVLRGNMGLNVPDLLWRLRTPTENRAYSQNRMLKEVRKCGAIFLRMIYKNCWLILFCEYDLTKKIFYNQLAIYGLVYKSTEYQMEEETRIVVDGRNTILDKPPFHVEEDGGHLHLIMPKSALYCRKIL